MGRYIDADNAIERLGAYLMADAQIEYGGMASEDINDWKELASDILKGTPSIDLEADYVPKDFHDKTCEEMAKRHQEEIADILERADADRPQGEWKSVKASIYPYGYDVECSVCGHRMGSSFGYKFCPMCGAQMKGADDETN